MPTLWSVLVDFFWLWEDLSLALRLVGFSLVQRPLFHRSESGGVLKVEVPWLALRAEVAGGLVRFWNVCDQDFL